MLRVSIHLFDSKGAMDNINMINGLKSYCLENGSNHAHIIDK